MGIMGFGAQYVHILGQGWGSAWVWGNAMHTVRTQCKVLYVGNYPNPSFGPFAEVCCSI